MDFNKITVEMENQAIAKFKEHGKGIMMGSNFVSHNDENSQKWSDLIDHNKWSERHITNKMLDLARTINTSCNDEMIGDHDVMFSHTNEFDKKVKFTYLEAYCFLRGALRYRRSTAEYRAKKREFEELNKFIEENKTLTEKRAEAKKRMAEISKDLNLE